MRALAGARLALAAGLVALLCALAFAADQQRASAAPPPVATPYKPPVAATPPPGGEHPNFVVIQTDDQTLDQLYATYTPPGGAPIVAMPNTLELIADQRRHLQPLLRLLPALLPLPGQPPHRSLRPQPQRPRQRPARTAATPASPRGRPTPTTSPSGCRTPATGRSTSASSSTATATQPFDNGTTVPPGWSAWHTVLNADTDHYYYGYTLNNNGVLDGPFGDSGSWETREYGQRRRLRLPLRAAQRPPLLLRDRRLQPHRERRDSRARRKAALLPAARLHRAARGLPPAGRARARDRGTTTPFAGRRFPHSPLARLQRGQRQRQAPLHPRSALPLAQRNPHLPRLLPEGAGVAALGRRRRQTDRRHRSARLHRLRNTYIIFTSDNGFFYGEHRLIGGKFLAYEPSTHLPFLIRGPGDQTGHPDRRAGRQHRHRADHPRTRATPPRTRASTAARCTPTRTTPACARGGRSSSSPSSRPTTSKRTAAGRRPPRLASPPGKAGGGPSINARRQGRQRLDRRAAQELLRDPPRPLQVHRVAGRRERALRHQQGPLRAQQQRPGPQLLPDPHLPPHRTRTPRDLRRPHLPGTVAETAADPRPAAQGQTGTRKGTAGTGKAAKRTGTKAAQVAGSGERDGYPSLLNLLATR